VTQPRRSSLRWLALIVFALVAAAFAYLNADERVAIHLGYAVFYQVPLVAVVFAVYVLGMMTMFALGLRHDFRVRKVLRQHGLTMVDAPVHPDPPSARPPPDLEP
jgi:uncharacterized integral membrane protein